MDPQPQQAQKLLTVQLSLPDRVQESALKAVWWDGARSGAVAALLAGLVIGYMLWRK